MIVNEVEGACQSSARGERRRRPQAEPRGSKRLHQLSKGGAESRESWGLEGVHIKGEFANNNADLRRKASADKGLRNPRNSCFQQ